ncbi:MAG: DUF819 family protein [Parvibaculaceae bacterium]
MTTLISADNVYGLLTVFLGLAAFGFWSERTKIGQTLSGVILVILAGLLLANFRVIPFAAPFYDLVWGYAVSLAIPLLLFRADFKKILPETGPMLIGFIVAAIGTVAGVMIGASLIPLGSDSANIAATLGASWIGGSMNFAATSQALAMDDASLLSAMAAADNVGGTLFLMVLVLLPASQALRRFIPSKIIEDHLHVEGGAVDDGEHPLNMFHIAAFLGGAALCCFLGYGTAGLIGNFGADQGIAWLADFGRYGVLFVTLYALLIANFFSRQIEPMHGDFPLGMLFMYVFFGVMGAGADVMAMIERALPIFGFVGIMAAVHLSVVLTAAKLLKLDLAEVLLASNAVALGPATAAAQAAAQGWRPLVTPAVMLGVLGYAIANFIGVAMAGWLS